MWRSSAKSSPTTEQGFEGSTGLRFRIHRHAAIAAEWHSEFGGGAGVELIW